MMSVLSVKKCSKKTFFLFTKQKKIKIKFLKNIFFTTLYYTTTLFVIDY
jgi:hypothetical protein